MDTKIDRAIEILLGEVKASNPADAALKITQAVLNLAHAKITLVDAENHKKNCY